MTLISMLRCKVIPGSSLQDHLLDKFLPEHGMNSLRLAFHILGGQCLDGEQSVCNDSQVAAGGIKGCRACVQCRVPPELTSGES